MLKVLNLYAGIGGNRKLWKDCHVTAVELDPDIAKIYSHFYPEDTVIVGDAHDYLIKHYDEFDFIWSSPPCQTHTRLMMFRFNKKDFLKYPDMVLYQEIIFLKYFCKSSFVVENVVPYYKVLVEPTIKIHRHYFWANFNIDPYQGEINFTKIHHKEKKELENFLGFNVSDLKSVTSNAKLDYRQLLRNCVYPKVGEHIFDCFLRTRANKNYVKNKET